MSRRYPQRPVVGVGAVVWKGDEVLLVRRANPPRRGQWSLPGGAQEVGETVFETARREILEETGIEIEVEGVVEVVDSIHPDDEGRVMYHYTLIDVCARYLSGSPTAGGDAAEAAWVLDTDLEALGLAEDTARVLARGRAMLNAP